MSRQQPRRAEFLDDDRQLVERRRKTLCQFERTGERRQLAPHLHERSARCERALHANPRPVGARLRRRTFKDAGADGAGGQIEREGHGRIYRRAPVVDDFEQIVDRDRFIGGLEDDPRLAADGDLSRNGG